MNHSLLALVAAATVIAPLAAQQPRTIYFSPGMSLDARIDDADRDVIVQKVESPPPIRIGPLPTLDDEAKRVFAIAGAIAVIRVENAVGKLVDSRDWVRTEVRTTVVEFIKVPTLPLGDGRAITFLLDGGEVRVKNARVRAGRYPIMRPGATYLLTLSFNPEKLTWHPFQPFLIDEKGILRRHEMFATFDVPLRSPFYGEPAAEIIARLKALSP